LTIDQGTAAAALVPSADALEHLTDQGTGCLSVSPFGLVAIVLLRKWQSQQKLLIKPNQIFVIKL